MVTRHGAPEVLQLVEAPMPQPQAGQVRVQVHAAGVSAYDLMFRRSGALPGTPKVPFTPGEDVTGVVDAVGPGVTSIVTGQRVAAGTFSLGVGGGYAEHVCLPAAEAVTVPDGVDLVSAVCLVVNYCTAHVMLHRAAHVQVGERVLVHGAAGGVGSALLDLGQGLGLEMYGTASAPNHAVVQSLGATPIDYRTEDFVARIRELTGEGVDVVFDPVGGARQLLRSYRALCKGGRLIWFGVAATTRDGMGVIPRTLATRLALALLPDGKLVPSAPDVAKHVQEVLPELLQALAAGTLHPVVAARVPLAEAARAHQLLEQGGHAGKVVLVTDAAG